MSIYRRGDVYWVRFQVGGVEVRRSSRSTSFAEARKFERAIRAKVEADVKGYQEGKRPSRTFAQAVDLWLAHGAPESMMAHMRVVVHELGDVLLEDMIPAVRDFKTRQLARGLSVLTINRRLAIVRRVLNLAHREWEWLAEPLAQKIIMFGEKGTERDVHLTREQFELLRSHVDNDEARWIFTLAAYGGPFYH